MARVVSSHRNFNVQEKEFLLDAAKPMNGKVLDRDNLNKLCELIIAQPQFRIVKVDPKAVKGVITANIRRSAKDAASHRKAHR